jgi:hypothetical protein
VLDVVLPVAALVMCAALLLHLETWALLATAVLAAIGLLAGWTAARESRGRHSGFLRQRCPNEARGSRTLGASRP